MGALLLRSPFALVLGLALLALPALGCVGHHHHHTTRVSHGHVYHHRGVQLVFDSRLDCYVVVGHPQLYFRDGRYYRHHAGRWERSVRINGPWVRARHAMLPRGIWEHRAELAERREDRREEARDRRDDRREEARERREDVVEHREKRREHAQERREDRREDARDRRDDRREAVAERREEQREHAQERREDRREDAAERREDRRERREDRHPASRDDGDDDRGDDDD